jgi:hypothetical protein
MSIGDFGRMGMASPLTEFGICSGHKINTGLTSCSADEVTAIKATGLTLRQIVQVAVIAGAQDGATEATVLAAMNKALPPALILSGCATSFKSLAIEVFRSLPLLADACYGKGSDDDCAKVLKSLGVTDHFTALSSMDTTTLPKTSQTRANSASRSTIAVSAALAVAAVALLN